MSEVNGVRITEQRHYELTDTPKIGGTVLRKDGSDSKNRTGRTVAGRRDKWPDWLADLASRFNPATEDTP